MRYEACMHVVSRYPSTRIRLRSRAMSCTSSADAYSGDVYQARACSRIVKTAGQLQMFSSQSTLEGKRWGSSSRREAIDVGAEYIELEDDARAHALGAFSIKPAVFSCLM